MTAIFISTRNWQLASINNFCIINDLTWDSNNEEILLIDMEKSEC